MVITYLLIINVAVYAVMYLLSSFGLENFFAHNLYLWLPETVFHFKIWELFSYMFIHDLHSIWHITFNMFALLMFGREIEEYMGHINFLVFYLFSGIGAGILQLLIQGIQYFYIITASNGDSYAMMSLMQNNPILPVIGASGAIYGMLLAYAMIFPERRLLFFFVVPMKARTAVIIFALMELFGGMRGVGNIAHFAHLGGMLFGWLYFKFFNSKVSRLVVRKYWKYERFFID